MLLGSDHKLAENLLVVARLDGSTLGSVSHYADALKYVQTHPPDFIFLDLKSVEADSLNLLRQLKHNPLPLPVFTIAFGVAGETSATLRAFGRGVAYQASAGRIDETCTGNGRCLPRRRGELARQIRISRDDESRNPHADERRGRDDRLADGNIIVAGSARLSGHDLQQQRIIVEHHQRHSGFFQNRSGQNGIGATCV